VLKDASPIRISAGPTGSQTFADPLTGHVWTPQEDAAAAPYWALVAGEQATLSDDSWACDNCQELGLTPEVVRGRRYGRSGTQFDFTAPLPDGNYVVRLYWLEGDAALRYRFDVVMQDVAVLSSFDPVAEAGGLNRALIKEFTTSVMNGELRIKFIASGESDTWAGISALSVVAAGSVPSAAGSASCGVGTTTIKAGYEMTLAGSLPGSSSTTYLWRQLSGPSRVSFIGQKTAAPTIRGVVKGVYSFQLGATDQSGTTKTCVETIVAPEGGAAPTNCTLSLGFALSGIPGAAKMRASVMGPSGTTATSTCTTSPCAVTITDRPGGIQLQQQYLSAADTVLASSRTAMSFLRGCMPAE
jgi:hypothetical protein